MKKVDNVIGLILSNEKKLLLVKSKRYDAWILPGGGLEDGELPEKGFEREMNEELGFEGLDYRLYFEDDLGSLRGEDKVHHVNFYLVVTDQAVKLNSEDNVTDYIWVTIDEIEKGELKVANGVANYAVPRLLKDGLIK